MSQSDDGYYEDTIEVFSPASEISSPSAEITGPTIDIPSPPVVVPSNPPVEQPPTPFRQHATHINSLFNETCAKLLSLQGRKQLSNTIMNEIIKLVRYGNAAELPKTHEALLGKL